MLKLLVLLHNVLFLLGRDDLGAPPSLAIRKFNREAEEAEVILPRHVKTQAIH